MLLYLTVETSARNNAIVDLVPRSRPRSISRSPNILPPRRRNSLPLRTSLLLQSAREGRAYSTRSPDRGLSQTWYSSTSQIPQRPFKVDLVSSTSSRLWS
jgi:hypothetical protein